MSMVQVSAERRGASFFRSRFVAAVALSLAGLSACMAPPVFLPPPFVDLDEAVESYPEGVERIEVTTDDGAVLRGVFVSAGEGAPVVLHLLESAGSVGSLVPSKGEIAWDLVNLGFSSLLVDYRGVGVSDGETSVDHLGPDAHAMWSEAVRRAGTADRVLVRGHSIGTVALALLLDAGARPGGVIALSPVDAGSVTRRFAREHHGWLASIYASVVFRPVADVDVFETLLAFEGPILYAIADDDELIRLEERERFREDPNGSFALLGGNHIGIGMFFQNAIAEEVRFLASRIGLPELPERRSEAALSQLSPEIRSRIEGDPAARERFDELLPFARAVAPSRSAATALGIEDPVIAFQWLRILRRGRGEPTLDALSSLFDLEDPAGPIELEGIEGYSMLVAGIDHFGGTLEEGSLEAWLATHLPRAGLDEPLPPMIWSYDGPRGEGELTFTLSRGLRPFAGTSENVSDARRRVARTFLKARGIPDRLVPDASGAPVLEYWKDGEWRPLFGPPES